MPTSPEPSALSGQITDPDLDLHDPAHRAERPRVDTLAAIAVGGAAGALARYTLAVLNAVGSVVAGLGTALLGLITGLAIGGP